MGSNGGGSGISGYDPSWFIYCPHFLIPGDNNTCGETYQGAYVESESEISSFTSFLSSIGASVDLSMNYHTYGEILLLPWAYTTTDPVDLPDIVSL